MEKEKLESRYRKLEVLKANLEKLMQSLASLVTAEKPARLKLLTAAINDVERLRQAKVQGSKKILDMCANELTSIREGVFTGAARKKSDLALTTCVQGIKDCETLMASTKRQLENLENEGTEVHSADDDEALRMLINKFNTQSKTLPSVHGKPFVVGRAPVVVVDSMNRAKLEQAGFKVSHVEGYTVIENQMVVGLGKDFRKKKVGTDKYIETVEEAGERFVRALNKAKKTKFTLASQKPYGFDTGAWFWVVTENELNRLRTALMGKQKLQNWGIA